MVAPEVARESVEPSDLASIFFDHDGHQVFKWTHYLAAYEEQFHPYRAGMPLPDGTTRPLRMLEIGIAQGGSLQMWRKYFGPEAIIFGVDLDERCAVAAGDYEIRIGSQADPDFLRAVVEEMGGVDIVLDDGSHVAEHQVGSMRTLFPLLSDGGVYAVEDLHTAYWPDYQGGHRQPGTFIDLVKDVIDDMHGWYHDGGDTQGFDARANIPRLTIYDSVAFIAKAKRARPMVTKIGTPTWN